MRTLPRVAKDYCSRIARTQSAHESGEFIFSFFCFTLKGYNTKTKNNTIDETSLYYTNSLQLTSLSHFRQKISIYPYDSQLDAV